MINRVIENFQKVSQAIEKANEKFLLEQSKSSSSRPQIVAVSKGTEASEIIPLIEHGHYIFGENRIQEAKQKWAEIKNQISDKAENLELHFIGYLQSNKAKEAIELFDVIESVDRPKLAKTIAKELEKTQKKIDLFIQVNTGEEEQKSGIMPNEADDFIDLCVKELKLPIKGVMCIPPVDDDSSLHFALLKKIGQKHGLPLLSMGMTNDYELAATMGATHVRIGRAIFK